MAFPKASSCSPELIGRLSVAALFAFLVTVGGNLRVYFLDPDLALCGMAVLGAVAAVSLWRATTARSAAGLWAALLIWSALSAIQGIYPRAGWEAELWLLLWSGLFVLGNRVGRSGGPAAVGTVLLPSLVIVAAAGLGQLAGFLPITPAYMTEHGRTRVLSTLNHPNNLACYLALLMPIVLSTLLRAVVARRVFVAAASTVLIVALLAVAAGTYSRGGQLGVAAGLVVAGLGALVGGRSFTPRRLLSGLAAVGAGALAFLLSPLGLRFRLALGNLGHFGADQRAGTWRAAAAMVAEHPWFGVGPGGFFAAFCQAKDATNHADLFTHAHNWYLHTAAEGGWPALLFLVALLVGAVYRTASAMRASTDVDERLAHLGVCAGIVGFGVAALLDVSVGVPAIAATLWFVLGAAWASGERGARPAPQGWLSYRLASLATVALLGFWLCWNRGHAHYTAMLAAWTAGRLDVAASELERARALDPAQLAYRLVRADLALLAGQHALAERELADLERAGQLRDSPYRAMLACLLAERGESSAARALLENTARRLDRAQPVVWTELGWLLANVDAAASREAFETALARNGDALGARAGLAELAWRAGDTWTTAACLSDGDSVGLVRDRVPRLLIAYGRLDPLLLAPASQAGRFWRGRFSWHGAVVPAITAAAYGQWAEAQTTR